MTQYSIFQENLRKLKHPAYIGIDNEGIPVKLNNDGSMNIQIVIPGIDIENQVSCACSCYASVKTVDAWESAIVAGAVHEASRVFTGIANNASAEMLIRCVTGFNMLAHININADCEIIYSIIENPIVSNTGTRITTYNLNRSSANNANALIYYTPTTTGGMTIVNGMDGNGKDVSAGTAIGARILKAGNDYIIRATNHSGNPNRDMSIRLEFMEKAA